MVDYSKLLTTAQSLIQANGKLITVTKLATAAADSTKPWRGPVDNLSPPANTQTLYAVADNSQEDAARCFVLEKEYP